MVWLGGYVWVVCGLWVGYVGLVEVVGNLLRGSPPIIGVGRNAEVFGLPVML